jgi:flagellar protein FlbD
MIKVTRLDNSNLVINANMIESVETTPDTVVNLFTGKKIVVKESVEEIIDCVVDYLRRTGRPRIVTPQQELKKNPF